MSTESDHAANVLGALSLALVDRMTKAVEDATGRSVTGDVALSALYQFLDRPSIDLLRRVLGLTSSGTVRLVDRLVDDGYVERASGPDGRTTTVVLTDRGREAAAAVTAARARVLSDALAPLAAKDRAVLEQLLSRVLVGMVRGPSATRWICRLCDLGACGRAEGRCPVERSVSARFTAPT